MTEEYNVINPEDIRAFLKKYSGNNPAVAEHLILALEGPLKKYKRAIGLVSSLPENSPEWLTEKWDVNKPWHEFLPDRALHLSSDVAGVSVWIKDSILSNAAWLQKTDSKGRPLKLLNIGTMEQARDIVRKYNQYQESIKGPSPLLEDNDDDIRFIEQINNDIHVVRLLTPKALDRESKYLNHCIGDGGYDDFEEIHSDKFYSFRDKKNIPIMTLQIARYSNSLEQCRAKNNKSVTGDLLKYLNAFILNRVTIVDDIVDQYVYIGGKLSDYCTIPDELKVLKGHLRYFAPGSVIKLPETLEVTGDFEIFEYGFETITLPQELIVQRSFSLSYAPNVQRLPQTLKVGRSIDIRSCNSIKLMPELLEVSDGINIFSCTNITGFHDREVHVRDDFCIMNCPNIVKLPSNVSSEGVMSFNGCSSLQALPKTIEVGGSLDLCGCTSLVKLSEKMSVKGKIYTDFGIFKSVSALKDSFQA